MQAWAPAGSLGELSHWFRDGYDNADAYGRRSGERYRRRGGFAGPKPSGLIGWAVLAMLLCAVTGVAALVYAIIANSFWEIREFDGAERAAERSKLWCVVSAAIFLCVFIVTGALALVLWSGRI